MEHAVLPDDEVSSVKSDPSETNRESQEGLEGIAGRQATVEAECLVEGEVDIDEESETIGLVAPDSDEESQNPSKKTSSNSTIASLCCNRLHIAFPAFAFSSSRRPKLLALMGMSYLILLVLFLVHVSKAPHLKFYFPQELLDDGGVYEMNDFRNDNGNTPPYWEDINDSESNDMSNKLITPHFGPCYLPPLHPNNSNENENANWFELMEHAQQNEQTIKYVDGISTDNNKPKVHGGGDKHGDDLAGLCRPGFIIIGAGKCGTSSLYHYLVGHPRVLPAKTKQIHYFKYFTDRPMKWYLSNFPPAESFLSNGALMTGEASPGYLPYPEVAHRLTSWMHAHANNGEGQPVSSPKIISIARNPLERSWSSYKYNYVVPVIEKLRKHDVDRNDPNHSSHSDEYYKKHKLFSFEDLIAAELKQLKECLQPGGKGEKGSKQLFKDKQWARDIFQERSNKTLSPLITIDEACYGGKVSSKVMREQWVDLVEQHPEKEIKVNNVHLVQSLIGRSLYVFPLEWWYELYPRDDIYLFCNEDLKYNASKSMSDLSDFLGLPSFDFTDVVSEGMYNVGGNQGYDTVTDWDHATRGNNEIPISDELRAEYLDFVRPYNERLFQLAGKRCNWD